VCVAETQAAAKKQGAFSSSANIFSAKATCDRVELARSDGYAGIQGQLAAAERDVLRWANWPTLLAIAIWSVCSTPRSRRMASRRMFRVRPLLIQ
jgi:hypothetical protein